MQLIRTARQTGDTIVEVMMAVVILSAVLGGTFAVAQRAKISTQANHERFQAQQYANEQAELIRKASAGKRNVFLANFVTADKVFCMNGTTVQLDELNAVCKKDNLYNITITATQSCSYISGTCTNVFNDYYIKVTWDSLKGGQEQVELAYGI